MPTSEDKIGYRFTPYTGEVERGKIRELALAIGDENPVYTDKDYAKSQGLEDVTVPPTFSEAIDMWAGPTFEKLMEELGIDPKKLLHGEQEYEYFQPIFPGDKLSAETIVTDVKTKRNGMALYTLETTYKNQHDQVAMTARMVLVRMP
ncbi:MaoC family dehydratase N-terminal domain-containing protein [Aneurinibacillus terranovensis]|uniref:MaoC family dehydratase N-terminal domain-containing protein n=1 Tax=Aneurinibacillus terranovensis TaxID=278991 RepID=UPI0004108682|nr:MaoC family dehydratase N-terminal domain-containing protein [Aneurinibacillus terranovensis]